MDDLNGAWLEAMVVAVGVKGEDADAGGAIDVEIATSDAGSKVFEGFEGCDDDDDDACDDGGSKVFEGCDDDDDDDDACDDGCGWSRGFG